LWRLAFLIGIGWLFSQPAVAQQAEPGRAMVWPACDQTAMTTVDMNVCASARELLADERMQKSYDAVACHLQPDPKARLAAAQQTWSAYRDAHCRFASKWDDIPRGSLSTMALHHCRAILAEARAEELDRWRYYGPPRVPCR
jgi:uncharacterized protein YecT (DUF1311 family)